VTLLVFELINLDYEKAKTTAALKGLIEERILFSTARTVLLEKLIVGQPSKEIRPQWRSKDHD
jgi:hypothetical protein